MTNNIRINDRNHTIEVTKKFAAAAKRFGTPEYDDLQAVRRDYPKYRIEIKASAKKVDCFKGLTYDYMENYIRNHNDDLLGSFFTLCGKTEEGEDQEFSAAASYGEIKRWFLAQFPELKIQRKTIDEILNKIAA